MLLVVVFHAFPKILPAGFVGVDVFFVISGYLITGILLREVTTGKFSILGFYGRRFRRIMPALLLVLLATWVAGRYLLLADEFKSLGRYFVAAATFTSNIALWRDAGYFDVAAESKPLLHLWSLAVEEQFYLVWPILLASGVSRRVSLGKVIAVLFALSLAANLVLTGRATAASFYLLPTRFWELLAGAGLAYLEHHRKSNQSGTPLAARLSPEFVAGVGATALLLSASGIVGTQPFPGWRAILPVLGATLLIAAGPSTLINRRVLSWRPATYIGLISYPLYLWHWPLLSLARVAEDGAPRPEIRVGLLALSVALAWFTWRYIEKPVQSLSPAPLTRKQLSGAHVAAALVGMAVVGTLGAMTQRDMLLSRAQKEMLVVASYRNLPSDQHGNEKCLLQPEQSFGSFPKSCYTPKGKPSILLWGDSFANHLYPGMIKALGATHDILTLTASSCPPVIGFSRDNRPHCHEINDWAIKTIERIRPETVVMQAIWFYDYKSERFVEKLDDTIRRVKSAGVANVVLVGQLPVWTPSLPEIIEREYIAKRKPIPQRSRIGIEPGFFAVDATLAQHFATAGVNYVQLMGHLCNEDGCPVSVGPDLSRDLITFDAGHLTNIASDYIVERFVATALNPYRTGTH